MRALQELWRTGSEFEMTGMDRSECLESARRNLVQRAQGATFGRDKWMHDCVDRRAWRGSRMAEKDQGVETDH